MKMDTEKYVRKPFEIDAVQVTEENFSQVAEWSGGETVQDADNAQYIKVKVHHPLNTRQTRAYVGDWVLSSRKGFKVYTDTAFKSNFVQGEDGRSFPRVENN